MADQKHCGIPILVAYITIQAPRTKVPPKICTQVPGQPRGEGWSWVAPFYYQFVNIQCLLYTSMINYFASYEVHIGLFYFLTSLCWNRHSEDSKKVRHLKIGPLVEKLQMIPHFCVCPGTGVHILGGTFVSRVYIQTLCTRMGLPVHVYNFNYCSQKIEKTYMYVI